MDSETVDKVVSKVVVARMLVWVEIRFMPVTVVVAEMVANVMVVCIVLVKDITLIIDVVDRDVDVVGVVIVLVTVPVAVAKYMVDVLAAKTVVE